MEFIFHCWNCIAFSLVYLEYNEKQWEPSIEWYMSARYSGVYGVTNHDFEIYKSWYVEDQF